MCNAASVWCVQGGSGGGGEATYVEASRWDSLLVGGPRLRVAKECIAVMLIPKPSPINPVEGGGETSEVGNELPAAQLRGIDRACPLLLQRRHLSQTTPPGSTNGVVSHVDGFRLEARGTARLHCTLTLTASYGVFSERRRHCLLSVRKLAR